MAAAAVGESDVEPRITTLRNLEVRFTAIEMGLPGFGLERLADVTNGGSRHIGVLAAPNIPEMLLTGREREFLGQFAFPAMSATPGAITEADIDEFVRTYSRPDGAARSASTSPCSKRAKTSRLLSPPAS